MRIAFHAPMKAPDHPVPSGDRQMARALVEALEAGAHTVEIASRLRTFLAAPDAGAMAATAAAANDEVRRVSATWEVAGPPDLWLTYHSYYKAPDLVGPRLAKRFGLPYGLVEASHARKRASGPWAAWHAANERAIRAAAVHFCFTPRDAEGIAALVGPGRITALPPFIAAGPFGRVRHRAATGPVRLATVAMMRPGSKTRSYAALAKALAMLPPGADWRLAVAGGGPEHEVVRRLFAGLPGDRIAWHGALKPEAIAELFAETDVYVWPGFDEAFGVGYLEAGAAGVPVLAMESGGIASAVSNGRTGLLTPEGDIGAYTAALSRLIADSDLRLRLGCEGRRMVLEERTVARAAAILSSAIADARPVAA